MSKEKTLPLGRLGSGVLALVLWIATAALGLVEIWVVREMVLRIYVRFLSDAPIAERHYWGGHAIGNAVAMIMAVLWIAVAIGGGEYHARHTGEPESWRLFARTLAVELAILVLALFI
jgi:hypothetical protein